MRCIKSKRITKKIIIVKINYYEKKINELKCDNCILNLDYENSYKNNFIKFKYYINYYNKEIDNLCKFQKYLINLYYYYQNIM